MQNVLTRQIKTRCDLCLSCLFLMTLLFHDPGTIIPELNPCICMDTVVYTAVTRHIASGHPGIGSIDNSITLNGRDISLPKIDTVFNRDQICNIGDAFIPNCFSKIFILYLCKFITDFSGEPDVHQTS